MMALETALILSALALSGLDLVLGLSGRHTARSWARRLPALPLLAWTVIRAVITGHAPFSGAYESMVFFMFLFSIKTGWLGEEGIAPPWLNLPVLGILTAALLLSPGLKAPNLLVPALQSPWMYIHVPAFFVGYVSLTFGLVQAVLYSLRREKSMPELDREVRLAFFFITLGILTGAFWGEQAWGHYWNWDPKEIWALVTWLILQVYFHLSSPVWKRRVVYAAAAAMLFTYLGVMFLLPGLHSYR